MKRVSYLFATFFFSGYFPFMPGTVASLITVLMGYFVFFYTSRSVFVVLFLFLVLTGFFVSDIVEKDYGGKDPQFVVIDEVSGALLSMFILSFFLNPFKNAILSFILFRVFDIFKPFPVKLMERFKGGAGIMLDDLMAGIMAGISGILIVYLIGMFR